MLIFSRRNGVIVGIVVGGVICAVVVRDHQVGDISCCDRPL